MKKQIRQVRIDIDTTGAKEAEQFISGINTELEKVGGNAKEVGGILKGPTKSMQKLLEMTQKVATTFASVTSSVASMNKAMTGDKKATARLQGYIDNLELTTLHMAELATQSKTTASAMEQIGGNSTSNLDKVEQGLADISEQLSDMIQVLGRSEDLLDENARGFDRLEDSIEANVTQTKKGRKVQEQMNESMREGSNNSRGYAKQTNRTNKAVAGLGRTAGRTGKHLSKLTSGGFGLVGVYASIAATVYAATEAFRLMEEAASFDRLQEQTAKFSAALSGINVKALAAQMQELSGGALSFKEAMSFATKGVSFDFTTQQLEDLTIGARKASIALGVNFTDAMDRVLRGISKQEIELFDELGVVTRLTPAFEKYAAQIGKTVAELTDYERQVALTAEVQGQLDEKFSGIDVYATSWEHLGVAASNAVTKLLVAVGGKLDPAIEILATLIERVSGVTSEMEEAAESSRIFQESLASGNLIQASNAMLEYESITTRAMQGVASAAANAEKKQKKWSANMVEALELAKIAAKGLLVYWVAMWGPAAISSVVRGVGMLVTMFAKLRVAMKAMALTAVILAAFNPVALVGSLAAMAAGLAVVGAAIYGVDKLIDAGMDKATQAAINFGTGVEGTTLSIKEQRKELAEYRDGMFRLADATDAQVQAQHKQLVSHRRQIDIQNTSARQMKLMQDSIKNLGYDTEGLSKVGVAAALSWSKQLKEVVGSISEVQGKVISTKTPAEDLLALLNGMREKFTPTALFTDDNVKRLDEYNTMLRQQKELLDIINTGEYTVAQLVAYGALGKEITAATNAQVWYNKVAKEVGDSTLPADVAKLAKAQEELNATRFRGLKDLIAYESTLKEVAKSLGITKGSERWDTLADSISSATEASLSFARSQAAVEKVRSIETSGNIDSKAQLLAVKITARQNELDREKGLLKTVFTDAQRLALTNELLILRATEKSVQTDMLKTAEALELNKANKLSMAMLSEYSVLESNSLKTNGEYKIALLNKALTTDLKRSDLSEAEIDSRLAIIAHEKELLSIKIEIAKRDEAHAAKMAGYAKAAGDVARGNKAADALRSGFGVDKTKVQQSSEDRTALQNKADSQKATFDRLSSKVTGDDGVTSSLGSAVDIAAAASALADTNSELATTIQLTGMAEVDDFADKLDKWKTGLSDWDLTGLQTTFADTFSSITTSMGTMMESFRVATGEMGDVSFLDGLSFGFDSLFTAVTEGTEGMSAQQLAAMQSTVESMSAVGQMGMSMFQELSAGKVAGFDLEIAAEKRKDGASAASLAKIKSLEAKKIKEQAKAKKASVIMSTAMAIMQGYAQLGPIAGSVAAAGMVVMGALQVANIDKAASGQMAALGGGDAGGKKITGGTRDNSVDLGRNASAGEYAFISGGAGQGTASNFQTPGRAGGGMSGAGTSITVGERGPEVITPALPVNVTPAGVGSGGPSIVFSPVFNAQAVDAGGMEALFERYSRELYNGLQTELEANNKTL